MSDDNGFMNALKREALVNEVCEEAVKEIERLRADMKELLEITKMFATEGTCRWAEGDLASCPDIHQTNCEWHNAEHMWESFCMSRGF